MDNIFINKESISYFPSIKKPIQSPNWKYSNILNVGQYKEDDVYKLLLNKDGSDLYYTTYREDNSDNISIIPIMLNELNKINNKLFRINLLESDINLNINNNSILSKRIDNIENKDIYQNGRDLLNILKNNNINLIEGDPNDYYITLDSLCTSQLVSEDTIEYNKENNSNTSIIKNILNKEFGFNIDDDIYDEFIHRSLKKINKIYTIKDLLRLDSIPSKLSDQFLSIVTLMLQYRILENKSNRDSRYSLIIGIPNEKIKTIKPKAFVMINNKDNTISVQSIEDGMNYTSIYDNKKSFFKELLDYYGFENVYISKYNEDTIEYLSSKLLSISFSNLEEDEIIRWIIEKDENIPEESDDKLILTEAVSSKDIKKRAKIEKLIYDVMNALDKTGLNTENYKAKYSSMNDDQFFRHIKRFINNKKANFELSVLPNKNEPVLEDIKEALDILGVPETEYVYMRHEGHKNNPIRSRYRQTVGYIHIRRLRVKRYAERYRNILRIA